MLPDPDPLSTADPIGFPILSASILLPLVWALVLPFLREARTVRVVALAGAGLELVLASSVLAALRPEDAGMQLVERAISPPFSCCWGWRPSGCREPTASSPSC